MTNRLKIILAFLFFYSFIAVGDARAGVDLWDFEESGSLVGWRFERATPELKDGSLIIKDGSFPVLFSPPRLNIKSSQNVFTLRIKSNKPGLATLSLYSAHTNFTYVLNFHLRATDDFHDYRVYLGDKVPGGDIIFDFAFKLPGNKLVAAIDSISFHRAGTVELAGIFWDGFWRPEPIRVGTSNLVNAPMFASFSMLTFLYLLIPITSILFVIFGRVRSGRFTRDLFFRAFLAGFILSAVLFTLRMDFNWLSVWSNDRANLVGKSDAQRLRAINDGNYDSYFDFLDETRALVPVGERIRPANRPVNAYDDHIARSVAYHLLPVRSSPYANYLWLYFDETDSGVVYDAKLRTLSSGDKVLASDSRPVKIFGSEAALYMLGEGASGRRFK